MLMTIGEFRQRLATDSHQLVADLQNRTGRFGTAEAEAWKRSFPKLNRAFESPSFQPLHLYFGHHGNLALEYQLPAASSWCDVVLLGAHRGCPSAVIVELKDWTTRGDKAGRAEGLIERQGRQQLHPSDQVRGYTEYCRQFHSAVLDSRASVHGCVLFTNDRWTAEYRRPPNEQLAVEYPLFSDSPRDLERDFPAFFSSRLTEADEGFAVAFSEGGYRQDRGFVAQIGAQILNPESRVFELLDSQRVAFAISKGAVDESFKSVDAVPELRKRVVIIKGPPGSGKSAIAARLWACLVTDQTLPDGDVVFATTSMSQNSNWSGLFKRASGIRAASGVVRKVTGYSPITTHRVGQLRARHGNEFLASAEDWRDHLQTLQDLGEPFRSGTHDNENLVSIVDEAHALINPEHTTGRGQYGFPTTLGPQAYHIIRSSVVSIFLMDPLQGFRQRENTSIEDIREWALEEGAGEPEIISLEGAQFRCAGSAEFVEWVESVLAGVDGEANRVIARSWRNSGDGETMDLRVFADPESWESEVRNRVSEGQSARLVSTYSRAWKTKLAAHPHVLEPSLQDFCEPYQVGSRERKWSRPWNFVPSGSDYTWFVAGSSGSFIADDPLCEVGCPYAVRGFDFDYVGILWLDDLLWRDGRWRVNPHAVEESGFEGLTRRARREVDSDQEGPAAAELLERVAQAYRILFTRALKGAYVWIPDEETRVHLMKSM